MWNSSSAPQTCWRCFILLSSTNPVVSHGDYWMKHPVYIINIAYNLCSEQWSFIFWIQVVVYSSCKVYDIMLNDSYTSPQRKNTSQTSKSHKKVARTALSSSTAPHFLAKAMVICILGQNAYQNKDVIEPVRKLWVLQLKQLVPMKHILQCLSDCCSTTHQKKKKSPLSFMSCAFCHNLMYTLNV